MTHADPKVMEGAEGTSQPIQEDRAPLLKTKLFIPALRSKRVARSGLIIQMHNSLDKTLILVSALDALVCAWMEHDGHPARHGKDHRPSPASYYGSCDACVFFK